MHQNSHVKVYEIDSFFYVFVYEQFSSVQMVFILELLMKAHLFKIGD